MFLIRPDPEYDESLESYIIRLAEENHFRVKKLFPHLGKLLQKQHGKLAGAMPTDLGSFNLYHANTSSSKRYWALSLLSDLCCKEHLPFLELSVLKTDRLFAGHHSSLYWKGLDIPKVFFRSENIPVCPQCLKEKSYIPTFWHISLVRACPRHGTALVFKCPQCGVGADYIRDAAVHSCRCGFDLISAKTEIGNPQLVKLAERVYGYKTKAKETIFCTVLQRRKPFLEQCCGLCCGLMILADHLWMKTTFCFGALISLMTGRASYTSGWISWLRADLSILCDRCKKLHFALFLVRC